MGDATISAIHGCKIRRKKQQSFFEEEKRIPGEFSAAEEV
jgi:hypothetical protein